MFQNPLFPGDPGTFIKGTKAFRKNRINISNVVAEKKKGETLWRLLAY